VQRGQPAARTERTRLGHIFGIGRAPQRHAALQLEHRHLIRRRLELPDGVVEHDQRSLEWGHALRVGSCSRK
jgi:hypothetical protein